MTESKEFYVGIDVGKTWLDMAVWDEKEVIRVQNNEAGIGELLALLNAINPKLIAVEASGGYEQPAAQAMILKGYQVAVVNPTRVRALAKALGLLAKTDRIDARLIATYAKKDPSSS